MTRRDHTTGIALILASSVSNQSGASLGAMAFPVIGPVGVVAVRQLVTAAVLTPLVRPALRRLSRSQWRLILALATVFSVMNLSLYAAIERIGLGLGVTLEFLGPLTVALASSRRVFDTLCAVLAGTGVVVLTSPGPATDVVGIGFGLISANAWGSYILLNRAMGRSISGLQGPAAASLISAAVWAPVAAVWFTLHPPTLHTILLAIGCGIMASVIPFSADFLALKRIPPQVYGTFTSINPVWAALAGWVFLSQSLAVNEWVGVAFIVASNVLVSIRGFVANAAPRNSARMDG